MMVLPMPNYRHYCRPVGAVIGPSLIVISHDCLVLVWFNLGTKLWSHSCRNSDVDDPFKYTRALIQERRAMLQALDSRKETLPSEDYLSCRRALLQAICELELCCCGRDPDRTNNAKGRLN